MSRFTSWATSMFDSAMELNLANIERVLAAVEPKGRLLDLGCDDGTRTLRFAVAARAAELYGVEMVPEAAEQARRSGIAVTEADLNGPLPLPDATFEIVVSNQVIEHLADTDAFVAELARLARPGGVVVTSTENLASWHNIAALLLGWQPFSLTNVTSQTSGLGNPVAIHRGETARPESWRHVKVFSYRGLRELFESHGLRVLSILGSGYYPFPARIGRLEPRHAAFLTLVATRDEAGAPMGRA